MIKIVFFVAAVFVLLWLLRGGMGGRRPTRRDSTAAPEPAPPPAQTETIVACAQCGVHLPSLEALPGRGGVFCSDPHRAAYERAHAGA